MVDLNKTTTQQYVADFLYLKTFGLMSLSGCAGSKAPAQSTDNNQDPLLISEDHVINDILSTKLYDLASSSAAWAPAVDDFLANANIALTSGEANEYGNYATSVFAKSGTVENTDGSSSDITFFILAPTVTAAEGDTGDTGGTSVTTADLSAIGAEQLIQNGDANVNLADVAGYTGAYVMIAVVQGHTADGELTGASVNMTAVTADGSDTELHTYYIAGSEKLKVDVYGTNVQYSHDEVAGVSQDDAQVTAHAALFTQVSSVTSEDLTVSADFAVTE